MAAPTNTITTAITIPAIAPALSLYGVAGTFVGKDVGIAVGVGV